MAEPADYIFTNARIFTADPENPWAESAVIHQNRVVFCGSSEDAAGWSTSGARVIDAAGGTLMPGFIDSHFHMLYGALNLDGILLDGAATYEDFSQTLLSYAGSHPEAAWLSGTGLRYDLGPGKTPLNRHHLDTLVADRPVYLNAYDGHTSWANTLALQLAGIFHGGPCGPNSEIVMDANGEATGEMREPGAYQPVSDLVPKPDRTRKQALLKEALRLAASMGITSVHNMNGGEEEASLYREMEQSGELTCRIYYPYNIYPDTSVDTLAREASLLKNELRGDIFRAGSVKFFIDGVIETYTGLLVDPYADDSSTHGAANYEVEAYRRLVIEADHLGLQIFTHAVGDLGTRWALDAYQAARDHSGRLDARHRVEHIEVIHPQDARRFHELGVIASMQPLHAPPRVDDGDVWPSRIGRQRWSLSFAWQTLREAGARLTFGSDWPVVTQNPLRGLSNLLNRMPWEPGMPHHRQNLADALIGYTRDAAFAEFQEHHKGQIKPGYLADLVLFDENLFAADPAHLGAISPRLTMMDGRIVHER